MRRTKRSAEKYELTRDQLLEYVELDLWARFQKRLWATVGAVLTGVTIAGLLGVPYYIRSQVDSRIRESTVEFERKSSDLLAHAKLLVEVSSKYHQARSQFHADAGRLLAAVQDDASLADSSALELPMRYGNVENELVVLLSKSASEPLLSAIERNVHVMRGDEGEAELLPGKLIAQEIVGASSMTRSVAGHPVHDGTLRGALRDLRYQALVVDALRETRFELAKRLRAMGGVTPTDLRIEEAKVSALEVSLFEPELSRAVARMSGMYLGVDEKKEFEKYHALYLTGLSGVVVSFPQHDEPSAESAPPD